MERLKAMDKKQKIAAAVVGAVLLLCIIVLFIGIIGGDGDDKSNGKQPDRYAENEGGGMSISEETETDTDERLTTEQQTTEEPTTEEPTAVQPTTEEPTTEELTAVQPETEEPTTVRQPETEKPTANGSVQQPNNGGQSGNVPPSSSGTAVAEHGALHVEGTKLVDKNGQPFQLYGMSTHGLAWFPQFVNYEGFKTLRDDWNTNCIRLAMYTHEYGGYCSGGNKEELKGLVKKGVQYATDLGMYVIIDWHVLNEHDPHVYKGDAASFFNEMSSLYSGYDNVIYEICNEPNSGPSWDSIKAYANEIIPIIRANDPDAVIIVGTPTWSQDIDQALASPLPYDNIMYAIHFYAATHTDWLRDRVSKCINGGLPLFVSEFGLCDASGNGAIDYNQSQQWMNLIKQYNLSYCSWSLSNKNETCSVIASWCQKTSGWSENELSESGKYIRSQFRSED